MRACGCVKSARRLARGNKHLALFPPGLNEWFVRKMKGAYVSTHNYESFDFARGIECLGSAFVWIGIYLSFDLGKRVGKSRVAT